MPPEPNPLLGTFLHGIGAASAALCYAPQRYLHRWSWQTYWLLQASFCWLILPWVFAWWLVPDLPAVLREAPASAMWRSYLLGALYGVGGIAFGVAIRYIGYSLTYALAISISCVFGTLAMPIYKGTLAETLAAHGGNFVIAGILIGGLAMLVTGWAGFRKEREEAADPSGIAFSPRRGLPIVIVAGVLSAVYAIALDFAQPLGDAAARHGAGHDQGLALYLFANPGAFTMTLLYTWWLAARGRTWGEYLRTPDGTGLIRNYALSVLTGFLWYFQFFFYARAHVRLGRFEFSSWAIHMILLILLSCGFGVAIGEWKACRPATKWIVTSAIALLLGAVGLISYGNYLATPSS